MKSDKLFCAIGDIDSKYIDEIAEDIVKEGTGKAAQKKPFAPRFKWAVPVAASLVIVVALATVMGVNSLWFSPDNPPVQAPASDNVNQADSPIRGLPVDNFNLADVQDNGISMDRMGFPDFASLFKWGLDCFAFVKVEDIKTVTDKSSLMSDLQISSVSIIKTLYGDCNSDTLEVKQYVIKDHFCLGTTNLLRKGAVYLLPLKQYEGDFYINGDMDVLFEVDDNGKVWSHSSYEDFNRYDGHDVEGFVDDLQVLISNDDFLLASSPFANVLRDWTLADIRISDKSGALSDEYGKYHNFSFSVNEKFSAPANSYADYLGKTGKLTVYADAGDKIELTFGKRYLLFLDCYDGIIKTNARMIAEIQGDGTIKAIKAADNDSSLGLSVFMPYDGYTVDKIREMVSRINP